MGRPAALSNTPQHVEQPEERGERRLPTPAGGGGMNFGGKIGGMPCSDGRTWCSVLAFRYATQPDHGARY